MPYVQLFAQFVFIYALFSVAVMILLEKWKVLEYYQVNRRRWMPPPCNFCFFFWFAFVGVMLIFSFGWLDIVELFVFSMCSAALAVYFYK